MKLAAIVIALVAAASSVHAGESTLGHPVQFFREGSLGDSAGSLRRFSGSAEDTVVVPTAAPTTLPTPAPTNSGSGVTPAPTTTSDDVATPAPTTTDDGSSSTLYGELGVAYSVTKEDVEAASTSSSSYTVPIAVAGCVGAIAAVAGVALVMRKRKQAAQTEGDSEEYGDDISTPVVKIEYNDDIATPVA